jgi:hypothetical protein
MATETLDVTSMLPNQFEPMLTNRFVLMIEGIDLFLVKTAGAPKFTTEEIVIPWINSTRYIAGKTTFETIDLTLFNPIAPSGAQQVIEWIRLCFESVSGRGGYADFYKRDIQLKQLDGIGNVVSLWDIKGAFVLTADFGDLQYETAEAVEIAVTIRFDNACLQY